MWNIVVWKVDAYLHCTAYTLYTVQICAVDIVSGVGANERSMSIAQRAESGICCANLYVYGLFQFRQCVCLLVYLLSERYMCDGLQLVLQNNRHVELPDWRRRWPCGMNLDHNKLKWKNFENWIAIYQNYFNKFWLWDEETNSKKFKKRLNCVKLKPVC